ncbi:MAG: XdhC family protein, partial [Chromatiales bacterium]
SERTSATRLERLADLGLGPETLARLHAPVGLPIGSHTPAEIAVAITAEITAERNRAAVAGSGNPQRSQR